MRNAVQVQDVCFVTQLKIPWLIVLNFACSI